MESQQPFSQGFQGQADGSSQHASMPEVTEKNTKGDIMKAYRQLMKTYEENVKTKKTDQAKRASEEAVVKTAEGYTVDAITHGLERLKGEVNIAIVALTDKLSDEAKKFDEVRKATEIERKKLKELYDIEAAAANLEDLVKTHEAAKEEFDRETESMTLGRKREEEVYAYERVQRQKRDEALYQEREAMFKKREDELDQKEEEFRRLQKEVETFPVRLEGEVKKARENVTVEVTRDMQTKMDLAMQGAEGEKKVLEARLSFLEQTIAQQQETIVDFKTKLDNSARQVQSIAEKAIEGSAGKQTLKAVSDIALQQARRAPEVD